MSWLLARALHVYSAIFMLALIQPACARPIRLDFTGDALSRPILEFRARSVKIQVTVSPPTYTFVGHAYVVFGREYPDGRIEYYATAGFSPNDESIKLVLNTPGHVEYTKYDAIDDASDIDFRVKITAEQEKYVRFILKQWDAHEYKLLSQNCVSLVKRIAKVIGLDPGDPNQIVTPYDAVRLLKNENDSDKPLRYAVIEGKRAQAIRAKDAKAVADTIHYIERHAVEVAQARDAYERFTATSGEGAAGIPLSFSSGTSSSGPFQPFTIQSLTWPWKPP